MASSTPSRTHLPALAIALTGILTGCPMEDDRPPDPTVVNGTDEHVTVVLVRPEEILRPGELTRRIKGRLAPGEEMAESSLGFCTGDNGIVLAETAAGEEIDRWDSEDCPNGEVPDEWIITDTRTDETTPAQPDS